MRLKINWCFFGIHEWSKWVVTTGEFSSIFMKAPREVTCQYRCCERCNKKQVEII